MFHYHFIPHPPTGTHDGHIDKSRLKDNSVTFSLTHISELPEIDIELDSLVGEAMFDQSALIQIILGTK